jgi:hypothetical protein
MMANEKNRISRAEEAADAILAEFSAQDMQPGWQLSYQQFLNRLPKHLRNGTDIDAGIQLLAEKGYVIQAKYKDPVVLTDSGFSAMKGHRR